MNDTSAQNTKNTHVRNDLIVTVGLICVVFFFIGSGLVSYSNTRTISNNSDRVVHTHDVITSLDALMSHFKDAETGQRGYLMTGNEEYLDPYNNAVLQIGQRIKTIEELTADNAEQQNQIPLIRAHTQAKLNELEETIRLRRQKGLDAALAVVLTDRGKNAMDNLRTVITEMREAEKRLREQRLVETENSYRRAIASGVATGLLGVFLALLVAYLIRRATVSRRYQEWLQNGQVGLGNAITGELHMQTLGDNVLKFVSEYCGAHAAVFYVKDGDLYRRMATYGLPASANTPEHFSLGDSLLGQAAKDARTFVVNDVPEGYLTIGSALGNSKPKHLLITSAASDGIVNCVIELGFINPVKDAHLELLEKATENISIAVKSANYRAHLQNLLEETQRQSEELQAQSEELRVSNEELEEQSRALKESQTRLEQQQAELEQTNSQLEEQTQLLETQKDDIERSRSIVQQKAAELEQASRYKSDFLANMSHELRTPLNSALILAKLLADNPDENLTEEQVKYAQTIQSSGNDLLALINDILDLSKIEAGHMEIRPENVMVTRLLDDLTRMFQPIADQKKLGFNIRISTDIPQIIETDRQRLEQILKNLLSNAFKFTEQGHVDLSVSRDADGKIAFAVKDTGIGISEEQQQTVFDAFRQADGTISRKYGGTGLGLSISRELARLLGSRIELSSVHGQGSTFTISIPEAYNPALIVPRSEPGSFKPPLAEKPADAISQKPPIPRGAIMDDREKLNGNSRIILLVEDDISFARILYNLTHELNFQCLIATTAEEALIVAKQYLPSAVVLDIGLPDNTGLTVLDRLKRDARTRHIPVHVVSGGNYEQTALSMGAVGYMLKPVQRQELANILKQLEDRLEKRMRNVLIVEDDDVQRDSMQKLLGSQDVRTVGVGTAAECLEKLKESTFDCMVLDISLPDASGYSLLETLSKEDAYSFPPVIVYTGHNLTADEEQKLRKYSKSIIIKGVKSPERLLDEVTLFLHQVVSELPAEQQKMLKKARNRDAVLENRNILVVEDDIRNVYSLTNILEPRGAKVQIARNGREALEMLQKPDNKIDLVLMDVMMPEMDGLTATREIRKNAAWKKLPIIMLTAKAMRDDQERCMDAGANDYMAKPLDVEKLLSLVRVWMPR